ncbi:molybdopterin-dependent oxidoreductase [Zobellella sp. An-6]|uniref:molybdopterin-dependent oxidoreductase n=1 Tax=Zobellella sp. An-6 TaxID=3400218 RepID=UPI0040433E4E
MKRVLLKGIFFGLTAAMRVTAARSPAFRKQLKERNLVAQIRLKDGSIGRYYRLRGGKISSVAGLHPAPDVTISFHDVATALEFMKPPLDQAKIVHAAKHFKVTVAGQDRLVVWFMQLLNQLQSATLKMGSPQRDGTVRYTTTTNGGPLFVYVKDGRIVRTTPIDLDKNDAASWTIHARGRGFTPRRRATVSPHALALRSTVYSENRLLYPMKRVDFDPNGERNPQNRGISGYERISWDEALDIVAGEINRMKREHGPGAVAIAHSSHHQWGNVGYYLSALQRFGNLIGFTRVHLNPDSWEGWYWGAQHHFGNSMRLGNPGGYGLVEDCLQECEQIVFWSSDPETTSGCYAGSEGTERRLWAKELGIDFIHIDPHFNPTAQLLGGRWVPLRPGSDAALAQAIMYVWVTEDLYDRDYVETRTTGFDEWRAYLLGESDGVAKTPEWQEAETGVPAKDVRALARLWAKRKTYLAAGGGGQGLGGAGRNSTGTQWARSMILLMAMQGWGKPGINFGNLQAATPLDMTFYFPGYAEGGISGDLLWTASAISNYNRMPHVLSMNPVKQMIPRQKLADAIIEGRSTGYSWDGTSLEAQFAPFEYPLPGHSRVHMLYRYGGSSFGTMANSQRMVEAYRHESLEFVVNQSIWHEGEARFADIILPACTMLERWDIGEWAGAGAYGHHIQEQLNHRMIVMQHKCIEPLGESKSDYQIFQETLERLGLGAVFTEGCSELDWCKRVFDSSDLPRYISWKEFLEKGYFVVPAPSEAQREPAYMRWFAEDRHKDVPEPLPLPSQYAESFGKGLQTPSGKIEFVSQTLQRACPDNPERPALNRYMPSPEGPADAERFERYPLQLLSSHPRYSFHTYSDGKSSFINDLKAHRILKDGYYYWVLQISPQDAAARGIAQHDLVRVFNERGAVLCAAEITPLIAPGVLKSFESSAVYDPIPDRNGSVIDRGGCVNLLTSPRPIVKGSSGMASSNCLVEIEKWMETSACPA